MTDKPDDTEDWKRMEILRAFEGNRKLISFEPLLGPLPEHVALSGIDWVIIGALSKGRKHIQPKKEWVSDIVSRSKTLGIPVFLKPSLGSSWKGPWIQEYPG